MATPRWATMSSSLRVCLLFAAVCLLAAIPEAFASSTQRRLTRRQLLSTRCSRHEQCGTTQFCLHPAFSNAIGSCSSCWRCCLFPEVYGSCPEKCNCNAGQACDARESCGAGLFCSVEDPWDTPSCKRCDRCINNSFELLGSCASACPSGDMSRLADLPHIQPADYLFLAFLANEISQQGAMMPDLLLKEELESWVLGQGASAPQAGVAVSRMLLGNLNVTSVSTSDWMSVVSGAMSESLLCPAYEPSQPPQRQPVLTFEGCFCNASTNARTFQCPAGQRCSRATFQGLETDALRNPTAQIFQAVCVKCTEGQYCPEGTYVADESNLISLACQDGYYCPSPSQRLECPAGSFCVGAAVEPISCNITKLIFTDPGRKLPIERDTVIARVRDKRDPTQGNFCPAAATRPNQLCSAGFYCPNASIQITCPKGHYCKAQSTAPWRCPWLTSCPEGTTAPRMSYMALVIAAIVIVCIPLIHFGLMLLDNSVIMEEDEGGDKREQHRAAAASRMTFRLLKSIKLTSSPLENKYRGFGSVSPPITMEFESLGLQIRPRGGEIKNVLMGVSGSFSPRRLNAILGPSGCGKTTFLNVLCGKISTGVLMGQVRINGEDIEVARLKKIMGFVPQDDIVHEDLTVRENLNYSARLRLPADLSRNRRRDVVHDALDMLGLTAIQHYRVGTVEKRGISGGQRKRVNIGLELVAMPSLLFLDEPTSGLDATSSADILNSLADMANLGMNVIMVIHQPRFSSFLMFDQVLLLGGGGHTVYLGSPSAAMLYFTKFLGYRFPDRENPSDILMDIIAGKLPCADDHRLKTCSQLVERWTGGGMAWVETLEQLNPTMTTKMSEVDPAILQAIDEEFDLLDEEGSGQINAPQLVKLFNALHNDISIDDAMILIRKINANRPASATPRSRGTSGTSGGFNAEDADGLKITKQQLLDAFQGVREGNDDNATDGAAQRNAAAKFYASNFLLPDLPEVKPYREALERRLRERQERYSAGGGGGDGLSASGGDDSSKTPPGIGEVASVGYSYSNPGNDPLDSDSYSPMGHRSNDGTAGGAGGGAAVVESVLRRSTLSPVRMCSSSLESPRTTAHAVRAAGSSIGRTGGGTRRTPGNRTIRSVALLPGLAQGGSVTSVCAGGAAAGAADSAGEGTDKSASGDLTAFAEAARQQDVLAALPRWRRSRLLVTVPTPEDAPTDGCNGTPGNGVVAGDVAVAGGGANDGTGDGLVSVAPGLVATNLAAMESLAKADVPLPQLPRRAVDGRSSATSLSGRSRRHSNAFNTISAYVHTYNALGEVEEAAEAARAAALAATASGETDDLFDTRRGSMLVSVGSRQYHRRLSAKPPAGGSVAGLQSQNSAQAGARTRGSVVAMRLAPPSGPPQLTISINEDDEYERASSNTPNSNTAALPPLLKQLVSFRDPAAAAGGNSCAIAEATEREAGCDGAAASGQPEDPAVLHKAVCSPRDCPTTPPAAVRGAPLASDFRPETQAPGESAAAPPANDDVTGPFGDAAAAAAAIEAAAVQASLIGPQPGSPAQQQEQSQLLETEATLCPPAEQQQPILEERTSGQPLAESGAPVGSEGGARGTPGVTYLPPVLSPGSPGLTGDTVIYQHLANVRQRYNSNLPANAAASGASLTYAGSPTGPQAAAFKFDPRTARMRTTRFAVSRNPADGASLGMSDLAPPEDASPDHASISAPITKHKTRCDADAATAASGEDETPTVEQLMRMRFDDSTTNSAPQLDHLDSGKTAGTKGSSSGRTRRASVGAVATPRGRKQRRQSWLQATEGSQDGSTPGSSRKFRKDTVYVNNLLSNALVGAWAATQSVTAGRTNQSMARILRPLATEGGPNSPKCGANACSSSNTPHSKASMALRSLAINRSHANASLVMPASRVPSTNMGVLHSTLAERLDMEEALASRKSQGFVAQLALLLRRGFIKYVRSFWPMRVVDTVLQLAAAFIIGLVHGTRWGITSVPSNTVMCMVCLGVLSCVAHLRTFSNNRVLLWRESSSGLSILAYYLSQNIIDQLWVFAAPALSLGVYYYLTLPRMPFSEFYVVGLFVCWWASGMAYLVSAVLPPQNVLMAGVFISLVFGAFLNGLTYQIATARGTIMEGVMALSYNRWAMEIVSINEFKYYQNDQRNVIILMGKSIGLCGVDQLLIDDGEDGISPREAVSFLQLQNNFTMDYCNQYKSVGYVSMFALGLGLRVFAFLFLWFSCWKKH